MDMSLVEELPNVLETFAGYSRCFSLEELVDYFDSDPDLDAIRQVLVDDPRFIELGSTPHNADFFVPEGTLFRWWSYLILRLAQAGLTRLTSRQLTMAMNSLYLERRWDTPPQKAIDFGQSFGFVSPAWTSNQYVFPLACVLAFTGHKTASAALESLAFADIQNRGLALNRQPWELVPEAFQGFGERSIRVLQAREGLLPGGKKTLEQIGAELGITRERVRQIEEKTWKRLQHPNRRRLFVEPLVWDVMNRKGSLILDIDSPDTPLKRFIAKGAGVPCVELPHAALVVFGVSPQTAARLDSFWRQSDLTDVDAIAAHLESEFELCLVRSDIKVFAESIERGPKRLNNAQKVYKALRHIGKPAHYSTVAEVYNSLFPEDPASEHNIHATLGRCEGYGVVWIGVRGTYALTEWGYERPSETLFDTVTNIVKEIYETTGKSVPFPVVAAEMGKHRQVVKYTSLIFATHCNPCLQRVSKDSFVPKDPSDQAEEEVSPEELDEILRAFERTLHP